MTFNMKIHHAHDLTFRSVVSDLRVARDFLKHYLPENIKAKVDLTTIKLCSNAFISLELRALNTDVLFSAELKAERESTEVTERVYFYFHFEQQTEPEAFMPWRMIKYTVPIIDRHLLETSSKTLPIVIPIVLYTGSKPYPYSVEVFDLFAEHQDIAREWMFNKFKLIDLSAIPDEDLRQHQWSGLLEMLLKHIQSADIMARLEELAADFQRMAQAKADDYVMTMIRYILAKAELKDKTEFFNWVKKHLPKKLEKESMTIAEQLRQEGMQQGIQQGMQQGELKAERNILTHQLTCRFGDFSQEYQHKIKNADADALLMWCEKILNARNIDDVFNTHH